MNGLAEKILDGLSPQQRAAATSTARAIRVVACAGAGKTECMTRRILWILHRGTPPEGIVAFTFTERAAREMKGRLLRRAGRILGPGARDRLGLLFVGTIHAFCLDLLRRGGGLGHFDLADEHQERAFLARHGWDLRLKETVEEIVGGKVPYPRALEIFRRSVSAVYHELIDRPSLRRASPRFAACLEAYERLLEDHRLLTFDGVIARAVDLLRRSPGARPPLGHLLVDEYQDVNPAQEALVRALAAPPASVFVVGDPCQCIYEWRGSDVSCFDRFARIFPGAVTLPLSENRRSREGIVRAANLFGAALGGGDWIAMDGLRKDGVPSVWATEFSGEGDEADWVVRKIRAEWDAGRPLRDMAILLGSVDYYGGPFIDRLRDADIPFEIGGRSGLFRHEWPQALGRLFAWFAGHSWPLDPHDASCDLKGDEVLDSALQDLLGLRDRELRSARREMERLRKEALGGRFENLVGLYQEVLRVLGFLGLDPDRDGDALILALGGRFNRLLNDYEAMIRRVSADPARGRGSRRLDWPRALDGLAWYLKTYALGAYEESADEDPPSGKGVRITTIHQAKGLEWPVVFLPGLLGRRFPSRKRTDRMPWLLDRTLFDSARYEGDETARRRVLYVALTRARDGLFLSWFSGGGARRSRFLDPVLEGLAPPPAALDTRVPPDPRRATPEEDPPLLAPTELLLWRRCPYRYRLARVWGYQAGLVPELGYGRAHHHVLRRIAERARKGERVEPALVDREIEDSFYLPYAPAGMREDMKAGARQRILSFAAAHAADLARTVDAEVPLEFPLGGAVLRGVPDAVLGENGILWIREYKTDDEATGEDEAEFQARLYVVGCGKLGRGVAGAEVVNLSRGTSRAVAIGAAELKEASEAVESVVQAILKREFPPRPGPACLRCDFARICRYSEAAGPSKAAGGRASACGRRPWGGRDVRRRGSRRDE